MAVAPETLPASFPIREFIVLDVIEIQWSQKFKTGNRFLLTSVDKATLV